MSNNPLATIFFKDSNGKLTNDIEQTKNIKNFFDFIKDDKNKEEEKIKVLDELKNKIKVNRYLSEFFSSHENKSIYIYLFDLYINKNSSDKLKNVITSLIEELCLNIQTGKEIYEYLFQKLTKIYRGEIPPNSNNVYNYLKLLNSVLCETDGVQIPKNYFACSGKNKFYIHLNSNIIVGYSFTININFKISVQEESKKNNVSNLIKFYFSNNSELSIDLKYPCSLICEQIRKEPIKILSNLEWINLIATITNFDNKLNLFININGENYQTPFKIKNLSINYDHTIEFIELFNNFYGEVSSAYMFSQKESGPPGVNSTSFLGELKSYKEGLWKKKKIDEFFQMIQNIYAIDLMSKSIYFKSAKVGSKEDKKKMLNDNLVFLFTPINYSKNNPNIVEDVLGQYQMQFSGNIRNHQFQIYQKKLLYVSDLNNFFPIAEMFLIFPETLSEQNFELFLLIISNMLNDRKQNLKNIKSYKFFNILSMFFEKYPQKIFTEKVLNAFYSLAKVLFINNYETVCSNYFKHILLNEKILSKYNINLQIEFWNKLYLFCQSDKTQIETFISINRLCLILRFYDRNKYTEMCCQEHLNMIKEEYMGSKKVMNPTMSQTLSNLKNIMDLIIDSQEPKSAVSLFKLLTLDLSPCLVKFILNIFINVFESNKNEQWKEKFVDQLLESKYEVIVINTFIHSLPDIRIQLLKFIFQVHLRLISTKNTNYFKNFEKMIKTCLLPDKMFYSKTPLPSSSKPSQKNNLNNKNSNTSSINKIEPKKIPQKSVEVKKPEPKAQEQKNPVPKADETKKEEPKKVEKKVIEPKKEDKRASTTIQGGAGKQNFLALLSKFDKPKNEQPTNNNIKKPAQNNIVKHTETSKKSFLQVREEILKKSLNNQENPSASKPINEVKNNNSSIENPPFTSRPYSNTIFMPALLNKAEKKPNPIPQQKPVTNTTSTTNKTNNNTTNTNGNSNSNINITNNTKTNTNTSNNNNNNNYLNKFDINGLIIKESEIKNYINKLYSIFMLWALSIDVDIPIEAINLDNSIIKISNTIEILFLLNNQLQNRDLIINFLNSINKLVNKPENCYEIFFNKKVYSQFLDITLENYKKKGKYEEECFNLSKNIIISLFINSCLFCEKEHNLNPGNEIETFFIWGNKMQKENSSIEKKKLLFDLLSDIFFELLLRFKIKFEMKFKLDSKDKNYEIDKNFIIKNYLMLATEIYIFMYRYKLDSQINELKSSSFGSKSTISLPQLRLALNKQNDISKDWLDFRLIHDILDRYKNLWTKDKVFKNLNLDNYKKKKSEKYELIVDKIVLDKDKKNSFYNEISLLCYKYNKGDFEYIIPLVQIISTTLMCIVDYLKKTTNEKDFLSWLKELKCFTRYIMIASCNLAKTNQAEYDSIQSICYIAIANVLIFIYNLTSLSSICKDKIIKTFISLLLLFFKIIKFHTNSGTKHKGILGVLKGKNDFGNSCVIQIYNDFLKDNNSVNSAVIIARLESLIEKDYNNKVTVIINSLKPFLENENLIKKILDSGFYNLNPYKKLVNYRNDLIPFLQETFDESYKKTILTLLPKYENELAKYSNNSLEKNIKNRNEYKICKKHLFSWRGYWSCRENFFNDNTQFKYKLINHYTKDFMKPILVPILDISYYLPVFSSFDTKTLFLKDSGSGNNKNFMVHLDIEKLLKTYDQSSQGSTKDKDKANNVENYLLSIYKKSNFVLYEKYLKIANNLEFGKEEEFSYIERETSNKKNGSKEEKKERKYFLSCLVKTSHHIKGVCFIDDKNLNFKVFLNQRTGSAMTGVEVGFTSEDDDYDQERKTCFGSYFVCHPKDKDLYKISINYSDIKWIFKRKYYYKNSALEIYTTTNKTFYFNFKYENDREIVLNEILKKLGDSSPIIDDLKDKEPVIGYENGIIQKKKKDKIKLSQKIKLWKNWEISNFEMLMWLNIFGNRSYNDISQYPIFPWILSNYEDPLQTEKNYKDNQDAVNQTLASIITSKEDDSEIDFQYRKMSLPMGMLEINDESMKRKELFIDNYETLKEENDENMKPYFYGSNYSNPIYICNFLIRLFPFTHISIELQGNKFDDPNRLFISVKNSFYNSTTQKTDIRELIPEFYYLPEMFRNINKLNMGKLDTGEEVNNVKTPCNDNPYDFIMTMRGVLESNKLSNTIQSWVDLIFGYKSRGKEAENAKNVFTEASYQENININKVNNKESYLRMVEFGLIPSQIMSKECTKRDKKESIRKGKEITNSTCDLKYYVCKNNENDSKVKYNTTNLNVLKMGVFSSEKITIFYNNFIVVDKKITFSTFDKNYTYEENMTKQYKYNNKMSEFFNPEKYNGKAIQFCQKGKLLIIGGFYDGKVELVPVDDIAKAVQINPFKDKLPILSVAANKDEDFLFFGNSLGNVRLLKLDKDLTKSKLCQAITDHMSAISHIDCNSELNLWASASIDGYINIYTFPLSKLIRCIKVPTNKCNFVYLSASPLPSIVAITEDKSIAEIFVYSINGKLLLRQKEQESISCPIIIKDLNTNDYLAYIMNDSIIIRSIPTLIRQVCIDELKDIYAIYPNDDMKVLYGVNKTGSEIYVIKDETKKINAIK